MRIHSVIAITGLGGHAFGSWRSRFSTERPLDRPMWLRDFLPQRFPGARVMTYGYGSSLRWFNDYRRGFIQCLRNSRRQCPVSHCLTKLPSNTLTMSLCYIETPHCLYRAQFGRDPDRSGRRTSKTQRPGCSTLLMVMVLDLN